MDNPKCPFCGEEMEYYFDDNPMYPHGFYHCRGCGARGPTGQTREEARKQATRRAHGEGTWIWDDERRVWECDQCGETTTDTCMNKPRANYCPWCGAAMKVAK